MNIFLARQPIFDRSLKVVGYELLFRANSANQYTATDGDQATYSVITNSLLSFGLDNITNGKKAFINFSGHLLEEKVAKLLPSSILAVEVLESVVPDKPVIDACRELKSAGYKIVLDDFVFDPRLQPLIDMADIIKVDFLLTKQPERLALIRRFANKGIQMLAEKVETQQEFQQALDLGFSLFQGFFFSKPVILSRKSLPISKISHFRLLRETNASTMNIAAIESIVQKDVSLSYQLLKFINSAAFGMRNPIRSIQQAIALLGQREFNKWVALITLHHLADEKPEELMYTAIIRARMAELIAIQLGWKQKAPLAFLTGIFSLLDAFLDQSMDEILNELPVDNQIKQALRGEPTDLRRILNLIIEYERGHWDICRQMIQELGLAEQDVARIYVQGVDWIKDVLTT